MKVAIVSVGTLPIPAVDGGAVETLIDNLVAENMKSKNLNLEVYSIYSSKINKEICKDNNITYYYIKVNKFIKSIDSIIYKIVGKLLNKHSMTYRYIMQRIVYALKIRKYLKENYDVIIFEASQFLSISLIGNRIPQKTKIVYHVHNKLKKSFFLQYMMNRANLVLSVSDYIKKDLITLYSSKDTSKLVTLRNHIDSNIFNPSKDQETINNLKEKYGIKSEDRVVVFVGRLCKEKGVKELCNALEIINKPNIKLLIIGETFFNSSIRDGYKTELQESFKNLQNTIIFTGYIEHNLIPKYLGIADIAVLPSLCEEAASLANMEVISCGVPLITTNAGGTPEYINDKVAILLNRDEKLSVNIAEAINKMLTDEDYYNSLKNEAIRFHQEVGTDKMYDELIKLLIYINGES